MELIQKNIKKIILSTDYVCKNEFNDERLNNIFNFICCLTYQESFIQQKLNINLETILYSKYYWYTKYKNRYMELYGKDVGIEQQQFKIIEEIEQKLHDVNWNLIMEIENGKI